MLDESSSYAEVLRKLGLADRGGNYSTLTRAIEKYKLNLDQININRTKANIKRAKGKHNSKKINLEDILDGKIDHYQSYRLKNRLIEDGYKERRCECCGLTEWNGQPIPLELHHKDGNHDNNKLENLEILCPNCHALTDNYTGKNIKIGKANADYKDNNRKPKREQKINICPVCNKNKMSKKAKMCAECYKKIQEQSIPVTKEQLKNAIKDNSFSGLGRKYHVSDNTVRKWCKKFGLPHRTRDINNMTDEEWNLI